ncbi:hypothetical protein HD554DRAFT_2021862, partial [Boletus coccyginus]
HGVSLLTNETVLQVEEAATYHLTQNSVGILCWKHCVVYTYLDRYDEAEQLTHEISSREVHLGKEMLVVIAHYFGKDQMYPVLAIPSCKEEDHMDSVMQHIAKLDTRCFYGPRTTPSSSIYGILSRLTDLNLYTSLHDMTLDFDYKHILKHELSPCQMSYSRAKLNT